MKKRLLIDLDGVLADFDKAIKAIDPNIHTGNYESSGERVYQICEQNPRIFLNLEAIEGAIEAVKELWPTYDIHFLSTPMDRQPQSYTDKCLWLQRHFGKMAYERLILTFNKDFVDGHYLVDDRKKRGVDKFKGMHIHFGTEQYPNWEKTKKYLKQWSDY